MSRVIEKTRHFTTDFEDLFDGRLDNARIAPRQLSVYL